MKTNCKGCANAVTGMQCVKNGKNAVLSHCCKCGYRNVSFVKQKGDGILDFARTVLTRIGNFISGRSPGAPELMTFIGKHASEQITDIAVCRVQLSSAITTTLNLITLGAFNKITKNNVAYDKLFHLFLVFKTESGMYVTERNEIVRVYSGGPKGETVNVGLRGHKILVGDFFEKAIKKEGDDIFVYDAFKNNCQKYVISLLSVNGLSNPILQKFIQQDLVTLVKQLPGYIPSMAKKLTDFAARLQLLMGRGKKKKKSHV